MPTWAISRGARDIAWLRWSRRKRLCSVLNWRGSLYCGRATAASVFTSCLPTRFQRVEKELAVPRESAIPSAMLSVIIPVFNERQTIREVIRRVCAVDVPKQIVVVDDASTDGTRQILEALEKNAGEFLRAYPDNRLTFVYQPENRGKGAAIRAGIPRVDEAITIIQDADLEYDPADYP